MQDNKLCCRCKNELSISPDVRLCCTCKEYKPLNGFRRDLRNKTTSTKSMCKVCENIQKIQYYKDNKTRILAQSKAIRENIRIAKKLPFFNLTE